MPTINLKSIEIPYEILRSSKRESIGIEVTMDKGLTVRAPPDTINETIERFLSDKEDWILKKLGKFDEIERHSRPKEFVAGERLSYIGRSYRLDVKKYEKQRIKFTFNKGKFLLNIPKNKDIDRSKIRAKVIDWYKLNATKKLIINPSFLYPSIHDFNLSLR